MVNGHLSGRRHVPLALPQLLACMMFIVCFFASPNAAAQNGSGIITTRDLATLRDISSLNISPGGRWAAFLIVQADPNHNNYDISWHVADLATRHTVRVANGGDMAPSNNRGLTVGYSPPDVSVWSPDGMWLTFLRRDNGLTQIWRAPHDGDAQQLTHNEADVRALVYSHDGRRILFQTEPSQAQLAQIMAAEGQTGFLYDQRFAPMFSRLPARPRDGDFGPTPTTSEVAAWQVWAYELETGRERPATETEHIEYAALTVPASPALSPRGAAAWTESRDPRRQGMKPPKTIVARLSASSAPIACTTGPCTNGYMSDLLWRSDRELLFNRRDGRRAQDNMLYAWRPGEARAARLILRTPGSLSGCAVARDKLICLYAQPDYPGRLVAIDLDSGAIETLYDPNPHFARFDLGEPPQRLTIRAESGAETTGYLVLPPHRRRGERLPLVIVTYDCSGFLRGGVGDEYPIYPFAAQGFAVLCYNLPDDLDRQARLDGASYLRWERGPGVGMRHRIEATLDAALAQLDRMGVIDPDRVGITGLSYGAEIVYFALPHLPRLTAAIASGGAKGPSQYPYDGPAVREFDRSLGIGAPEKTPERWAEISFSPRVQSVYAPLLINVDDMEFLWGLDSVTALEQAGRAVETYVFPDEYHVKWQPAHRLAIYNRNIDWMNFWLRDLETGLTGDASQYTRWRAMRTKVSALRGAASVVAGNTSPGKAPTIPR